MKNFVPLLLATCMLGLVGCSGNAGQAIEGKVGYADGAPLGIGALTLTSGKNSYSAAINSDGTYKIENVVPGEYKVCITGAQTGGTKSAEGQMDYDADGNYVEPPEAVPPMSLIKESMSNPETSGLTLKVPGDYAVIVERP